MSDVRLDVYLLGEPQPGIDRSTLVRNLAATFKKDVPVIEKMLRKPRSLLKADVDAATANKYQTAILKAGGQCELVNHGEQLFPSEALSPVTPRAPLTIAPVEPTALTPAIEDEVPTFSGVESPHYHSPYSAPNASSHSTDYFCYKCGRGIATGVPQCPYCRAPQVQLNSKEKATAGVLAFFLGGLGVHRFYLGQWWGVFYLLFWFTFIPSIVSVIEAFVFWLTPNERWNRKYGQVPMASTGFKVAIAIAGVIGVITIIGMLAAVSLPAYQEYTIRSKIQASMPLVDNTKQKVASVINGKNFYPSENVLAGLPENISDQHISSIRLADNAQLVVTYNFVNLKDNNTMIWTPKKQGATIGWTCKGGTLPDRYRSSDCRNGVINQSTTQSNTQLLNNPSANVRSYSADKRLSIVTSSSWKRENNLNKEALIGMANARENLYVVVLEESRVDFDESMTLKNYADLIATGLEEATKDFYIVEPPRDLIIGQLPAHQQALSGTVDGVKVTYIITCVERENYFYVIYAWTLASHFSNQKALLQKVSESFQVHEPQ